MFPAVRRTLTATTFLLSSTTMAADNPEAHVHGLAQLQLAISGDHIEVVFLSPAHNLLGFEHAPQTQEQRESIHQVTEWLHQTPLANTEDGSCTIHAASIHHGEPSEHDSDHDHDSEHHDDEHEHEHHDEADHHDEHSGHSDFEVTQVLDCPELAGAEALTTPLMEEFARLQQLDIAWVGPAGQGAVRLTQGDKKFIIKP